MTLPKIYKKQEIDILKECGTLTKKTLSLLKKNCNVGMNLLDLDKMANEYIIDNGGTPACFLYKNFPKNLCTSVDEVILHGIPDSTIIKEGMIINVDCPIRYKNFYTDATINICVGKVSNDKKKINDLAYNCLMDTISIIKPGITIGEISKYEETYIKSNGYDTIKEFRSHGVGKNLHEPPYIPHYYEKNNIYNDYRLKEGNVLTIEPVVVSNNKLVRLDDGWGVRTEDSSFGTYWEHTVLITNNGNVILT